MFSGRAVSRAANSGRPVSGRPAGNGRCLTILGSSKKHAVDRIAVLYQAVDAPVVNGVRKPVKPGGKVSQVRTFQNALIE